MTILWETCRQDFEPDGGLRDIYLYDTTMDCWRRLYVMLRAYYALEYFVDSQSHELPTSVDEAIATKLTSSPMLAVQVGAMKVHCHFFLTTEIEMDIDPRQVTSQAALDDLLAFLRRVGDTLSRPISMCYEGGPQYTFLTYEPAAGQFRHC